MPLVAISNLPTFARLQQEHHAVLSQAKARHQDIREIHIGICNMMPDAALKATERQFMRLIGDCNQIVQFHVHLFTLPSIQRGEDARHWIGQYYESFEQIQQRGVDALVLTGANPETSQLETEAFWPELIKVIEWARINVTSTLCACFATHAVLSHLFRQTRLPLASKCWGVYSHRVCNKQHPLVRHMNTRFDVPHSRLNAISRQQFEQAGLEVLVESEQVGVHLAVSPDGIRQVFFQGHPEYDDFSLLKEFKREIDRWWLGQIEDFPPCPENYFNHQVMPLIEALRAAYLENKKQGLAVPEWPEKKLQRELDNTWRDTALSTFNNWLGLVYQLTDKNLGEPFMPGIDPENPLAALE